MRDFASLVQAMCWSQTVNIGHLPADEEQNQFNRLLALAPSGCCRRVRYNYFISSSVSAISECPVNIIKFANESKKVVENLK